MLWKNKPPESQIPILPKMLTVINLKLVPICQKTVLLESYVAKYYKLHTSIV
jgi:hypothetical protein